MDRVDVVLLGTFFVAVAMVILNVVLAPQDLFYPLLMTSFLLIWQCIGSHHSQVIKGEKFSG